MINKPQNKYISHSKISEKKFREILRLFERDLSATDIAILTKISRNSVNSILKKIRLRIVEICNENDTQKGEFEVDESYFGPRRVRGKRGRGAGSKTIVFGLLKRNGKVYTEIIPDCKSATLSDIIRGKADVKSIIYSDGWAGYDGLVDLGYEKHFRVNHSKNEFSKGNGNHINGIESFWGFAKHRLQKFNGIRKCDFELYLKECELRFNFRGKDLYHFLLDNFRENPL